MFQTKLKLKPQDKKQLDYNSKLILLGSCFSENIGEKFNYLKFQSTVNPFGILFHPLAIENLITRAINKDYYSESDLHYNNEQWCCLDAHSKLNQSSKDKSLDVINKQIEETHYKVSNATHMIITLGTSWVYRHIELDSIVANCHKLPQRQFQKELLSVDTIVASLKTIVASITHINPNATFIFTVSPVRHIKDGFIENNQSKSHLITAIHSFINQKSSKENRNAYYFPSYEIMMDELRDYRFYNADMLHPSEVAVEYIWEKFKTVWLTDSAIITSKKVAAIQAKKAHRPLNPNSQAHQDFLTKLQTEIEDLCAKHPYLSFI